MNAGDAYSLVDMLIKTGLSEIDILGGEPMLVPWMRDFVKDVTGFNITVNISTNGSLPEVVDRFSEIRTERMNVGFSVHGFSKTHNSLTMSYNFDKAVTGIKQMLASGKSPVVKSTLLQKNKDEIRDLASYLANLGVKRYYLLHEDIIGNKHSSFSFPEFMEIYSEIKTDLKGTLDTGFVAASGFYKYGVQAHSRCDAGISKIAVMPDGSAFPCNLFFGFKEFCLGNLLEEGIDKLLRNPILADFKKYGKNICLIETCKHYSSCMGGCPAHSYYFYRSFDAADPRCSGVRNYGQPL